MNNDIFQLKPSDPNCTCIICRKQNVQGTNEHIIPKALGGYMHTWSVCKTCNSRLGDNIDNLLIDHYLIQWERYRHQLKGESNKSIPNPFEGTHVADDGEKYRIAEDAGVLTPHVIQKIELLPDGKTAKLTIDPSDVHKADTILQKYCKRKGLAFNPADLTTKHETSPSPKFSISTSVDISSFRLGLLKIAYEFTASLIPRYLSDTESLKIAKILETADLSNIKSIDMSSGFGDDVFPQIFGDCIDFTNEKRHYILLYNLAGKLYCFIRLFNVFTIGIKMSDTAYSEADKNVIAINDFGASDFHLYTLLELVEHAQSFECLSAKFMGGWNEIIKKVSGINGVGFYSAEDGQNLCFDASCNPVGSVHDVIERQPEASVTTICKTDTIETTYVFNGSIQFLLAPTNQYVPLESVTLISKLNKI